MSTRFFYNVNTAKWESTTDGREKAPLGSGVSPTATKEETNPVKGSSSLSKKKTSSKTTSSTDKDNVTYKSEYIDCSMDVIPALKFIRDICAGKAVNCHNLGKVYSGKYYVTDETHIITDQGYSFTVDNSIYLGPVVEKKTTPITDKQVVEPKVKSGSYVVKKGDTLWDISKKFYGDSNKWRIIWEANKDMLTKRDKRNATDSGHWIYPGQKLVIP